MRADERRKVFVVGRNKTGTTSIAGALRGLGFRLGSQPRAELFLNEWAQRDFREIIRYCRRADAFQDVPFSLDYTYQAVDAAYPGSRFVLTVRDSADAWYESLIRFHSRVVGKDRLPTADDLKAFPYRETGWLWRQHQLVYGVDERTLYDREIYTRHYAAHNRRVMDYFRHRPGDLLVLNVADADALQRLCRFLDLPPVEGSMPHLNRSG